MACDLEKLAKQIFMECEKDGEPVTMEDAMEMAKMESGAKGIRRYEISEDALHEKAEKKAKPRNVKVSDSKKTVFDTIWQNLSETFGENAEIVTDNKLITVKIDGKLIKIDLIEQKKKK